MGKYENGSSTRETILKASKQLFLEKGYRETSNDDICRAAHINRTAINYHFRDKENLRYEILWELLMDFRKLAVSYHVDEQMALTAAMYLSWHFCLRDPRIRRFYVDYSRDYPVYVANKALPTYYRILYHSIFEKLWPREKVSSLSFSAVYGQLMSEMLLTDSDPDSYTAKELFLHGMKACLQTWNMPEEIAHDYWNRMIAALDLLPDDIHYLD